MSTWLDHWDRRYTDRVRLLVEILPVLASEPGFALKGGTAINLFEHDMPRLSVDIDLAWLPVHDYAEDAKLIAEALGRLKVMPVSVIRIDDRYLAQRNIPKSKTLAGKRIALVDCGMIGGYLSDMLVKAGAGSCGGKLTLVDFDGFLPQNIGRHRLPGLIAEGKGDVMITETYEAMHYAKARSAPACGLHRTAADAAEHAGLHAAHG
ncbi:nucleotidyl transferase AbiEii/AbiGii toxin family protein [Thauera sp.]|uniref:nucleotidyl transferase AbiEii/AbiGii toxin family protein n=1 Tax=Thauera sp. TaxID=1905334 RepID=UPI0039E2C0A0